MDELGRVIAIEDGYAVVNIKRRSACGSCKACEMGKTGKDEINISVKNELGAVVGDDVRIEMQTPDILMAAFLVYMIPLLALLAGILIVYFAARFYKNINEWMMLGSGLLCLCISLLFVRQKDKKLRETRKFEPKMIQVVKTLL